MAVYLQWAALIVGALLMWAELGECVIDVVAMVAKASRAQQNSAGNAQAALHRKRKHDNHYSSTSNKNTARQQTACAEKVEIASLGKIVPEDPW
jgi:hypothetical protein